MLAHKNDRKPGRCWVRVVGLVRVTLLPDQKVSFTYDTLHAECAADESYAIGRLTRIVDPSGQTRLCYDRHGNVRRKVQVTGAATLVVAYRYNNASRLVGNISNVASVSEASTQALHYDRLDRLDEVRDQNAALIEQFTYSKTGDRTTQQVGTSPLISLSYAPGTHRLSAVGAVTRTFDANGNTLSGHLPPLGQSPMVAAYDQRNRLSAFNVAIGPTRISPWMAWDYNGRGERVATRFVGDYTGFGPPPAYFLFNESGQRISLFVPATGNPDSSPDKSGSAITSTPESFDEVIWIDQTPVARVRGTSTSVDSVHYIHSDHLNSPRALVNAQTQGNQGPGTVVWRWKLNQQSATGSNAFGNQPATEDPDGNGTAVSFDLRFPGQQYDSLSKLHYNYFRDYEAGTGRYVESDPVGLGGGVSTYGYALGSPMRYVDPLGEFVFIPILYCAAELCALNPGLCFLAVSTTTTALVTTYGGSQRSPIDNQPYYYSPTQDCPENSACSTSRRSGKERASDVPTYAHGYGRDPNENCHEFAVSVLQQHYGANHAKVLDRGPGSEYSQIKKNCERGGR